jgi:hypothetical protein
MNEKHTEHSKYYKSTCSINKYLGGVNPDKGALRSLEQYAVQADHAEKWYIPLPYLKESHQNHANSHC